MGKVSDRMGNCWYIVDQVFIYYCFLIVCIIVKDVVVVGNYFDVVDFVSCFLQYSIKLESLAERQVDVFFNQFLIICISYFDQVRAVYMYIGNMVQAIYVGCCIVSCFGRLVYCKNVCVDQ